MDSAVFKCPGKKIFIEEKLSEWCDGMTNRLENIKIVRGFKVVKLTVLSDYFVLVFIDMGGLLYIFINPTLWLKMQKMLKNWTIMDKYFELGNYLNNNHKFSSS